MKFRKITAISIVLAVVAINFYPLNAYAILNSSKKKLKQNSKSEQSSQTKLGYINYDWWQDFNDEYLNAYILKAVQNNQDLKVASLRVEEARQGVKAQFANELPSFTVGAAPSFMKNPGQTNTASSIFLPMIASYEADIFLKNHDKTKSIKKSYEASIFNEQATYIAVVSAVGATYYNIVKLDKLISIQENIVKDRKTILDLMKLSNNEGIVSTSDLVKAEKSYLLSYSDLIDLKKARLILLNSFAVLIAESPNNVNDFKRISYDELVNNKPIPTSISSEIIEARPDYKIAVKMVEKSKIDVRVAKKEFLPVIDIGGLLSFNYMTGALSSMNWTNALMGIGGMALLPIFTGGKRIANLKIMKNRYEQVLQNYYKTNLTAIQEINDSLSSMKLDDEKYRRHVKSLEMEAKDFVFTQAKYDQGVISYLDLIQKKESMLTTEKLVASCKIQGYVDQINLYKAVAASDIPTKTSDNSL